VKDERSILLLSLKTIRKRRRLRERRDNLKDRSRTHKHRTKETKNKI